MNMNSRQLAQSETGNLDRIILHHEGIFWKAYERSAFAFCTQVRQLKTSKHCLKVLGGEALVSVGFPCTSESSFLSGLKVLSRSSDTLVVESRAMILEEDFIKWKLSQPFSASSQAGPVAEAEPKSEAVSESEDGLAERIRAFDLSNSTPMDCMMFLSALKKTL